jgi:hypothetical protein
MGLQNAGLNLIYAGFFGEDVYRAGTGAGRLEGGAGRTVYVSADER